MVDDLSRAWAAGFFEAEGAVVIALNRRTHQLFLAIVVTQVDIEPIERLNASWPSKTYYFDCGKNNRPTHIWRRTSRQAAQFLNDIRPFVVRPRVIERVDLALEFQGQKQRVGRGGGSAYRAIQDKFWVQMKQLNARGRKDKAELPPRRTLQIDQQLKLLIDPDDSDLDVTKGEA